MYISKCVLTNLHSSNYDVHLLPLDEPKIQYISFFCLIHLLLKSWQQEANIIKNMWLHSLHDILYNKRILNPSISLCLRIMLHPIGRN
jgi:hypothetical protein